MFLYDPRDLKTGTEGGVQLCTREFLDVVRAASEHTELFEVGVSRHPLLRARRKVQAGVYLLYDPSDHAPEIARAVEQNGIDTVFVNRAELTRFAVELKEMGVNVVLMSHGNQSGDDLYEAAGEGGARSSGLSRSMSAWKLGRDLVFESRYRHQYFDGVCVMSEEEGVLERWLGARATAVLPRLIAPHPLDWDPVRGRAGFVGTLDHTPNRVALEKVFTALLEASAPGVEVRLVGRPVEIGRALEGRFPFVTYLGGLSDEELKAEATTWSLFLNPILWLSRGASMKLGQGLKWGLPVITTASGRRGYEWERGEVVTTMDYAPEFAQAVTDHLASDRAVRALREECLEAARSAPSIETLASRVAALVKLLNRWR